MFLSVRRSSEPNPNGSVVSSFGSVCSSERMNPGRSERERMNARPGQNGRTAGQKKINIRKGEF
jgi:hypothetical protein